MGREMNWNNLGSVLRCPKCGNPFNDNCAVSDDPYFDLFGETGQPLPGTGIDNCFDAAAQRHWIITGKFQMAPDSQEANEYIKCDKCDHVDSMACWSLRHRFDEREWASQVELDTDDVGARPSKNQQRLHERAAELDAIADEAAEQSAAKGEK